MSTTRASEAMAGTRRCIGILLPEALSSDGSAVPVAGFVSYPILPLDRWNCSNLRAGRARSCRRVDVRREPSLESTHAARAHVSGKLREELYGVAAWGQGVPWHRRRRASNSRVARRRE